MRFFIVFALLTATQFACPAHAADVLPNGVRIDEIPASDDRFELVVGYQAGIRSETRGLSGLSSIIGHLLASSAPARSIAVAAYGAGGEVEFLSDEESAKSSKGRNVPRAWSLWKHQITAGS